jgi:hypothetical protein
LPYWVLVLQSLDTARVSGVGDMDDDINSDLRDLIWEL